MPALADQRLFEAYLNPVLKAAYGTAYYLTHHRDDAEDLVQEAAGRAFTAFSTFQSGTNFKAWFLRILTNLYLNQRRRERRSPQCIRWEDAQEAYLSDLVHDPGLCAAPDEPAAAYLKKLTEQEIADAFAGLPTEYRVVCTLYFMEELRYQDIAEIVGCPVGTVRSRIHRGRKALQSLLRACDEPSEDRYSALIAH